MLQLEARHDEGGDGSAGTCCYFVVALDKIRREKRKEVNTYQLQLMLGTSRAYDVTTLSTMMTSAQDTKRGRTDKTITRSIIRKHQWTTRGAFVGDAKSGELYILAGLIGRVGLNVDRYDSYMSPEVP